MPAFTSSSLSSANLRRMGSKHFISDFSKLLPQFEVDMGHWEYNSLSIKVMARSWCSFQLIFIIGHSFLSQSSDFVLLSHKLRKLGHFAYRLCCLSRKQTIFKWTHMIHSRWSDDINCKTRFDTFMSFFGFHWVRYWTRFNFIPTV